MTLRRQYLQGEPVGTIYFGGGTPSLMPPASLRLIMEALRETFPVLPEAEITLEANPDDIRGAPLEAWAAAGINRLSIGIQSFFDADLQWMNRAHDAQQAVNCITLARSAGFDNLSIDLIYGSPTLTDENWKQNLELAASLKIPHLSCYALTVEPGTALDHMTRKQRVQPVSPDDQARQFLIMAELLQEKGYEHYEISNLSLPGRRSRHNSSYWSGTPYLGLGPSAHSFDGLSRQWNIAHNPRYIESLKKGELVFEKEVLTKTQRFNEYILTSLRTREGSDITYADRLFGEKYSRSLRQQLPALQQKGWVKDIPGRIVLTRSGQLFADGIAAGLFMVEDEPGE